MAQSKKDVWDELSLLQNTWIRIWQTYMNWFTWHFGIHVVAIGAIFINLPLRTHAIAAALFMMLFTSLAIAASAMIWVYSVKVRNRADTLRGNSDGNRAILGGVIISYASAATLATNILVLAAWFYVAIYFVCFATR